MLKDVNGKEIPKGVEVLAKVTLKQSSIGDTVIVSEPFELHVVNVEKVAKVLNITKEAVEDLTTNPEILDEVSEKLLDEMIEEKETVVIDEETPVIKSKQTKKKKKKAKK